MDCIEFLSVCNNISFNLPQAVIKRECELRKREEELLVLQEKITSEESVSLFFSLLSVSFLLVEILCIQCKSSCD